MATVVARHLAGLGPDPFTDTAQPVRLKVLGLQVTGFGDIHAGTEGAVGPCERDHTTGAYRKQLFAADGTTVLGRVEVSAAV
ncbi:hypothetical protein AB0C52_29725 [Streptomyces sp. NPDC048717]|uniref:hypothetical protein n=1 Tax=Streptomyces sp. NPDC048717 TaxID=3154928 RepID=UPI0034252008